MRKGKNPPERRALQIECVGHPLNSMMIYYTHQLLFYGHVEF